tara:strand:- start:127 stop:645 length:519 start_codon:yes stop_codon:yes gene_type:complete
MGDTKKPKPTSSFFTSVYVPAYSPAEEELVRGQAQIKTMDEIRVDVEEQVGKLTSLLSGDFLKEGKYHQPRPLSLDEGRAVIKDRQKMLKDIARIRGKLKGLESTIDKRIGSEAPNNFTWHFKKRPKLRKALKAITGKAKNFVTYEDYKLALDIKAKLELEGADEYFEETED